MNAIDAVGMAGGIVTVAGAFVVVYRYWRGTLVKATKADVDKLREDLSPKIDGLVVQVSKVVDELPGVRNRLLTVEVETKSWRELLVRLLSQPDWVRLTVEDVPSAPSGGTGDTLSR